MVYGERALEKGRAGNLWQKGKPSIQGIFAQPNYAAATKPFFQLFFESLEDSSNSRVVGGFAEIADYLPAETFCLTSTWVAGPELFQVVSRRWRLPKESAKV